MKLFQGIAAVSTVTLGVAGAFIELNRAHSTQLAALQAECDAALERAASAEQSRDRYIATLEQDARSLREARSDWVEREEVLQESRLDLELDLRERDTELASLERSYQRELGEARAAADEVEQHLAALNRQNRELEHYKGELLEAYGDRILSSEAYRRIAERELRELSRTLAYEQWQRTVRIAVEGECQSTWGARKFQRCARRVEAALSVHEQGALECIIGGYGLPFYTADQQVQVFPENSVVLKHGVVVPCDRSLHDRNGAP